jgi:hypothetical protein
LTKLPFPDAGAISGNANDRRGGTQSWGPIAARLAFVRHLDAVGGRVLWFAAGLPLSPPMTKSLGQVHCLSPRTRRPVREPLVFTWNQSAKA